MVANNSSTTNFSSNSNNINHSTSSSNSNGNAVRSLANNPHKSRKVATSPKKSKKVSPPSSSSSNGGDDDDLRPRRRASQTYFFKYQLANNPLKAEEEDLKLALLASLNDCDASNSNFDIDATNSLSTPLPTSSTAIANSNGKAQKKTKKQSKPKQNGSPTSEKKTKKISNPGSTKVKKESGKSDSGQVASQTGKLKAKTTNPEGQEKKRKMMLIKLEKSKLKEKAHKLIEAAKKDSYKRNNIHQNKKTAGRPRSSLPLSPDSELRKLKKMSKKRRLLHLARHNPGFFQQSCPAQAALVGNLTSNGTFNAYGSASSTATNSAYFPYDPLQKREPLDENYLRKYKPETGVFLTFICFRKTAPHYPTPVSVVDGKCISSSSMTSPALTPTPTTNGISTTKTNDSPNRLSPRQKADNLSPIQLTPELNESKVSINSRPGMLSVRVATASGSSRRKTRTAHDSPQRLTSPGQESLLSSVSTAESSAERRHPTRQSPRLATRQSIRQQQKQLATATGTNSVRKYLISENDIHVKNINCNNSIISQFHNNTSNSISTAYDNSIDYEEDVKRASIALEDMAQEISHQQQAISNSSSSSDSNNNNNNFTSTKSKGNSKTNHSINHYDRDELAQNHCPSKVTNDLSNCHHTRKSIQDNKHAGALDKDSSMHSNHSSLTTSPFKNNKHLVKGLMTREFAGAFADEETIFESISHHKL